MSVITYEYNLPTQLFLIDQTSWPSISLNAGGLQFEIRKPYSGTQLTRISGTISNEGLVIGYSVFHVDLDLPDESEPPEWSVGFEIIKDLLRWLRVAGQYWVGVEMSASRSLVRGSITGTHPKVRSTNFGASQTPIPPRPLDLATWLAVGRELQTGKSPRITDILLADAMLSFCAGDFLQAIIRFGVTAEIELNNYLEHLLNRACFINRFGLKLETSA